MVVTENLRCTQVFQYVTKLKKEIMNGVYIFKTTLCLLHFMEDNIGDEYTEIPAEFRDIESNVLLSLKTSL